MKTGVGFPTLLQIALIVLKLCHAIEWSWFWVLSPTWICAVLAVICAMITVIREDE